FHAGMLAVAEAGCDVIVEIGPQPSLLATVRRSGLLERATLVPSLRKDHDDRRVLAESVAGLHVHGADIDFEAYHAGSARRRARLPTYPFQRTRHWVSALAGAVRPGSA